MAPAREPRSDRYRCRRLGKNHWRSVRTRSTPLHWSVGLYVPSVAMCYCRVDYSRLDQGRTPNERFRTSTTTKDKHDLHYPVRVDVFHAPNRQKYTSYLDMLPQPSGVQSGCIATKHVVSRSDEVATYVSRFCTSLLLAAC